MVEDDEGFNALVADLEVAQTYCEGNLVLSAEQKIVQKSRGEKNASARPSKEVSHEKLEASKAAQSRAQELAHKNRQRQHRHDRDVKYSTDRRIYTLKRKYARAWPHKAVTDPVRVTAIKGRTWRIAKHLKVAKGSNVATSVAPKQTSEASVATSVAPKLTSEACSLCNAEDTSLVERCACCAAASTDRVQVSLKFGDEGAEKISAELEQRAATEAEMMVTAGGLVCKERLAILERTFDKDFIVTVLSRLPFNTLLELACSDWYHVVPDALNTSLLLEDFREIRQWQDAPADVRTVCPCHIHSVFEPISKVLSSNTLSRHLIDQKFLKAHPSRAAAARSGATKTGTKVNLHEFRSLLRSLSYGALEGLPFHPDKLILGGGAMAWCVQSLSQKQKALCQAEIRATRVEEQLSQLLQNRIGVALASQVMGMATECESNTVFLKTPCRASQLRQAIRQELANPAWGDADLDLFVVSDSAEETIKQVVGILQRNAAAVTGGKPSVVLRTKNTLTVAGGWPLPHFQVVCKTVRSTQELLAQSDMDCTAMAYDGHRVWAATRALRAMATGYNFLPKQVLVGRSSRKEKSIARFAKYYQRGFGVVVFEHCRHQPRCDHEVPLGSLDRLCRMKVPRQPNKLVGSPETKGRTLAHWMLTRAPELNSNTSLEIEGLYLTSEDALVDLTDVRTQRAVPSDVTIPAELEAVQRGSPFRDYPGSNDLIIPRGAEVCADTLREYVKRIGRPDLMHESSTREVKIEPKNRFDRQKLQTTARGKCYMCKTAVTSTEPWPMCEICATFNKRKREQCMDCTGLIAFVTGGRIKIGRECALRLLRNGATVVVTSRFPQCSLERYRAEKDFETFQDRLIVVEADFRRLQSVQRVVDFVLERFDRLDILIHNAAQTIRRPPAYFESLVKKEERLRQLQDLQHVQSSDIEPNTTLVTDAMAMMPVDMSLMLPVLESDREAELRKAEWFPLGLTDAHGEQLDLRSATSWTHKMEDIEMPELAEVLAINLVVPYLLTARWSELLRKAPFSFVVFVTSQEGSFTVPGGGSKNATHPHTNAAKAGLNMLAKTIAGDLHRDAVFTSAVDPGWVSWMKPGGSQAVEEAPLTEADGAARVLDPIFSGIEAIKCNRFPPVGVLFKDFRVTPW